MGRWGAGCPDGRTPPTTSTALSLASIHPSILRDTSISASLPPARILSLRPCIPLSIPPSIHTSFLHLSIHPCIPPPSLHPSLHLHLPPSIPASLHLSIPLDISIYSYIFPMHLSIRLSIHPPSLPFTPPKGRVSPQIQELPPCFLIKPHSGAGWLGGAHVPAVICRTRTGVSPTAPCTCVRVPACPGGSGGGAHLRCAAGAGCRSGRSRASCRSCGRTWARGCPPAPPGTRRW